MATDPAQAAADWASRLAGSTQKIQRGVQAVTVAPGQAAARQKNAYLQGVTSKVDKWASNVSKVSTGDWQAAMVNKGLPRIATGAQAAQPKFQQFMTKFLPAVESARSSLPPRGDIEANINRMTQFVRAMSKFSNT